MERRKVSDTVSKKNHKSLLNILSFIYLIAKSFNAGFRLNFLPEHKYKTNTIFSKEKFFLTTYILFVLCEYFCYYYLQFFFQNFFLV